MSTATEPAPTRLLNAAVIVAALGYFVDVYDLLLFGFVRQKSLLDLGFTKEQAFDLGLSLQNWQMFGMLVGGILWGVLGDKLGRVRVLYFSIALYSIANILNGFAHGATDYALYRCIAGIGLAGELGAGITLVAEVLKLHQASSSPQIMLHSELAARAPHRRPVNVGQIYSTLERLAR